MNESRRTGGEPLTNADLSRHFVESPESEKLIGQGLTGEQYRELVAHCHKVFPAQRYPRLYYRSEHTGIGPYGSVDAYVYGPNERVLIKVYQFAMEVQRA